jgi:hypothetical protein
MKFDQGMMQMIFPPLEFLAAIAMCFLMPCRNRWAGHCMRIAGFALFAHIVLSHFYAQITIHRIYFAYYAGLTAGLVIGIFFVLLAARQLGRREPVVPGGPMLN